VKDAIQAGTVTVTARSGTEIEAYLARPLDQPAPGGVVVIHHAPGYDQATKEITRRFATWGYAAVMPNLNHRIAPGADPDDAAAAARARGGKADDELLDDVATTNCSTTSPAPSRSYGTRASRRSARSATAPAAGSPSSRPPNSTSTRPWTATARTSSSTRPPTSRSG
jgi:hypothetical protein